MTTHLMFESMDDIWIVALEHTDSKALWDAIDNLRRIGIRVMKDTPEWWTLSWFDMWVLAHRSFDLDKAMTRVKIEFNRVNVVASLLLAGYRPM